jgi:hypothetical protein
MKLTNMSFPLMLLIRVTQGVFALLVLALSGFGKDPSPEKMTDHIAANTPIFHTVAHWYNSTTTFPSPSQINFLIFTAIWSFISLASIELLPRYLPRSKPSLFPPSPS